MKPFICLFVLVVCLAGCGTGVEVAKPDTALAIPDTEAPVVEIISPQDGHRVSPNSFLLRISVSDNIGVTFEEILWNGVRCGWNAAWPWDRFRLHLWYWTEGPATLQVRVWDAAGNRGDSQVITIYR